VAVDLAREKNTPSQRSDERELDIPVVDTTGRKPTHLTESVTQHSLESRVPTRLRTRRNQLSEAKSGVLLSFLPSAILTWACSRYSAMWTPCVPQQDHPGTLGTPIGHHFGAALSQETAPKPTQRRILGPYKSIKTGVGRACESLLFVTHPS
jgi:hypothetical protein